MNFKPGNIITLKNNINFTNVVCESFNSFKERIILNIEKPKVIKRRVAKNEIGFIVFCPKGESKILNWLAEACFPAAGVQGLIDITDFIILSEESAYP